MAFGFDFEYKFDCKYDFLAFELVMFTAKSSTIYSCGKLEDQTTRFDLTTILQTPFKSLVAPQSFSQSRTHCQIQI